MDKKLQKQIIKNCRGVIYGFYDDFTNPEKNYRGENFTWGGFKRMCMGQCQSSCWMANLGDIIPKSPEDYNPENPERNLTAEHKKFIAECSAKMVDELFKKEGIVV